LLLHHKLKQLLQQYQTSQATLLPLSLGHESLLPTSPMAVASHLCTSAFSPGAPQLADLQFQTIQQQQPPPAAAAAILKPLLPSPLLLLVLPFAHTL
jgi:hypothetical protein